MNLPQWLAPLQGAALRRNRFSATARQKISDRMHGVPKSAAHRAALRAAWVVRKQTKETAACSKK